MSTSKTNLLDLFIICNVASSAKLELFCKFLTEDDVDVYGYFDESVAEKHNLPYGYQLDEGYYYDTHFESRLNGVCTLIDGFKFGVYDSYEDALNAAKAYTAESLLEKFSEVFAEAKAAEEERA